MEGLSKKTKLKLYFSWPEKFNHPCPSISQREVFAVSQVENIYFILLLSLGVKNFIAPDYTPPGLAARFN